MEFKNQTTQLGLINDVDFWATTDSSSYPTKDKTRNINAWYDKVDTWIWQATGTWEYDDANYNNLPIATTALVDNQRDYEMPSEARKVDGVSVKDDSGDWVQLDPIDKSQMGVDPQEFFETKGIPRYYDLVGRSILLYPSPDSSEVTTSGGLKLFLSRKTIHFSSSATTREPGFASCFHRILSIGAARDFCIVHIPDRVDNLDNEMMNYKKDIQEFYGARHREMMPAIRPKVDNKL